MPLEIIKFALNKICMYGEVIIDDGKLFWYFSDQLEDRDFLWEAYCADSDAIKSTGHKIRKYWSYKDSCGFEIKSIS